MPLRFTDLIHIECLLDFCSPLTWKRCINLCPMVCAAIHMMQSRPRIPPLIARDQGIELVAFHAGIAATEALRATSRRMLWQTQPMWSFLVFMHDDFQARLSHLLNQVGFAIEIELHSAYLSDVFLELLTHPHRRNPHLIRIIDDTADALGYHTLPPAHYAGTVVPLYLVW